MIFPYFFEQKGEKKLSPCLGNAYRTCPKRRRWGIDSYFSLRVFTTNMSKNFPTCQVKKTFWRHKKCLIITAFLWRKTRKEIKRFWGKKQSSKWLHNFSVFFYIECDFFSLFIHMLYFKVILIHIFFNILVSGAN